MLIALPMLIMLLLGIILGVWFFCPLFRKWVLSEKTEIRQNGQLGKPKSAKPPQFTSKSGKKIDP